MIEHRPFSTLGTLSNDWLEARLHFHHGDVGHPSHVPLGPLVIWNDDEFAPHSGFGLHGHRDIEIVTWIRSGAITHEDDCGNRIRLTAGSVQAMSAGTGVRHSERNAEDEHARVFQIWLRPRAPGGARHWASQSPLSSLREGHFVTLASGDPDDVRSGALAINTDARVRVATLRAGTRFQYALPTLGAAYLVSDQGRLTIGDVQLAPRDGAAVTDESSIWLTAQDDTDAVLVELFSSRTGVAKKRALYPTAPQ